MPDTVRCLMIRKTGQGPVSQSIEQRPIRELPAGDVLIRVEWSSLNFKDALATQGHPGIVRRFPHVPGIDAAGTVIQSDAPEVRSGDRVIATGYEIGVERWGGWCDTLRVPAAWIVPLPEGLSTREAMILGTAGFTAAQCVRALQHHGIVPVSPHDEAAPSSAPIVVTGATGGVGLLSLMILARLGCKVVAVSGKRDRYDWLRAQGAARVLGREAVCDDTDRPLLSSQWAGAIDTVGGQTLSTLLRSMGHRGCVAACGLVGGHALPLTVYPFILRGVTLAGIDSALCPYERRLEIWRMLAGPWKPDALARSQEWVREVCLDELPSAAEAMLAGTNFGRVLVGL
jgi:putative YhdH/YhfP family quinone oxidoreductase